MIGLIGLGKMGAAMAQRLIECGETVIAWDQDEARIAAAAERGAKRASGPRAIAEGADTVLSIITEDTGARGLWEGKNGFLETDIAKKLFIEMSTLQPMTVRALAGLAAGRGAAFIDSPLLGSIPTVRQGKLVALVGGAEADVTRARATLTHLTARIEHIGPVGAGAAMKLVVNNMMGCYLQILAESLLMGEKQGLSLDRMIEVIGASITATPWFQAKKPVLLGGHDATTLDIRTLRKDILSVVTTAAVAGVPVPAASVTAASMSAAVSAGEGGKDIAELVAYLRATLPQTW
ncbi:MAG TPA: NAD(P)-dependent oxidoreductase [Stellaceae bacterium]|nr:NAD(P)-dependent oxidoreductase [Stellaceae bacterium]